eukprot:scaffold106711_cov27-Phaeocystis_antarctica.AAC.1
MAQLTAAAACGYSPLAHQPMLAGQCGVGHPPPRPGATRAAQLHGMPISLAKWIRSVSERSWSSCLLWPGPLAKFLLPRYLEFLEGGVPSSSLYGTPSPSPKPSPKPPSMPVRPCAAASAATAAAAAAATAAAATAAADAAFSGA